MRINTDTAVATSQVLLVPYDSHHVVQYHSWMQDPVSYLSSHLNFLQAIQEATASEPLSLAEEHENQASWRASRDKLTFIVCRPLSSSSSSSSLSATLQQPGAGGSSVWAGVVDAPERMAGDVNLFLYPFDGDNEEEEEEEEEEAEEDGYDDGGDDDDASQEVATDPRRRSGMKRKMGGKGGRRSCTAEIDIMIADERLRGRGLGRAAVAALLHYVCRHLARVLREYEYGYGYGYGGAVAGEDGGDRGGGGGGGGGIRRDEKENIPIVEANGDGDGGSVGGGGRGSRGGGLWLRWLTVKIKEGNAASIALFRGLGFRQRGGVNYFGEVELVLEDYEGLGVVSAAPEGYRELVYRRQGFV